MSQPRSPRAASALVSEQMSRMPREGTGPELALRRRLHQLGLRFRVNLRELPGRPDIALTRARLAVFVDGCFWHQCPEHAVIPKNNRDWWEKKLAGNVERDARKDAELEALGWLVIRVWEHDDVGEAARRVAEEWRRRTGREPSRSDLESG